MTSSSVDYLICQTKSTERERQMANNKRVWTECRFKIACQKNRLRNNKQNISRLRRISPRYITVSLFFCRFALGEDKIWILVQCQQNPMSKYKTKGHVLFRLWNLTKVSVSCKNFYVTSKQINCINCGEPERLGWKYVQNFHAQTDPEKALQCPQCYGWRNIDTEEDVGFRRRNVSSGH